MGDHKEDTISNTIYGISMAIYVYCIETFCVGVICP